MYKSLDKRGILTEEQKGCKKGARGANDLVFIGKMVLKEPKRGTKNLALCWIGYRKAYDMVPDSWIMGGLPCSK